MRLALGCLGTLLAVLLAPLLGVLAMAIPHPQPTPLTGPDAVAVGGGGLVCPVVPPVSFIDSWGYPRPGGRVHQGQDLFAARGQPLLALVAGTVADVATYSLGGRIVWLTTDDGAAWYYAHLQAWAPGLREGQRVAGGQVLGTVGTSGNAAGTPPHLHLGWKPAGRRGAWANPYHLLDVACPDH